MRLGGPARWLVEVDSPDDISAAVAWAREKGVPFMVLGGGSNVIFSDGGFAGLVILVRVKGFEVLGADEQGSLIRVGAGEVWDRVVERSVELGLSGIEALSLIPGTAGGTPVQNVGAYGQEISQTLLSVEAYDTQTNEFVTLSNQDCDFSYRSSIFNGAQKGRYVIAHITLRLHRNWLSPPFYASLQDYMDRNGLTDSSPATVRAAVIAVRTQKLPDPNQMPNTGSFFKNPIIDVEDFLRLSENHPKLPHFVMPNGQIKLFAGWLIEQAGLRGYAAHGMKTFENNALVFINEGANSFADLAAFKAEVVDRVFSVFGVTLQQEPETVNSEEQFSGR